MAQLYSRAIYCLALISFSLSWSFHEVCQSDRKIIRSQLPRLQLVVQISRARIASVLLIRVGSGLGLTFAFKNMRPNQKLLVPIYITTVRTSV